MDSSIKCSQYYGEESSNKTFDSYVTEIQPKRYKDTLCAWLLLQPCWSCNVCKCWDPMTLYLNFILKGEER